MIETITLYFHLFKEFFQIGLFSFGGGYATLPFLLDLTQRYDWYSAKELSQMIAVASITPGPVGINVATYAGMKAQGVLTALIATSSEILPSLCIVILVSKLLRKFSDNFYVQSAIFALKPTSCALLSCVGIQLIKSTLITPHQNQIIGLFLFIALLLVSIFKKKDPLWFIGISAIIGLILTKMHCIC
ncbi:MAG: chromate transporter [Candidatus Gastranaerophilales bacterium]|nr:chromate transporter [Candidatus Gastranaerophilales bacterium]